LDSEVEMALATSRVMYDMDIDDEECLDDIKITIMRVSDVGFQTSQELEESFEIIMDLLEEPAFTHQHELLNNDEVADLCWDISPMEVVKAIHSHWKEKRWRKAMDLVQHF